MSERDEQVKLAQIGLRALVDEATGYQEARPANDLRIYADQLGVSADTLELILERAEFIRGELSHPSEPA